MGSIADVSVKIQTASHSVPSTPSWFGEAVLIVGYLKKHGVLDALAERVHFARRRFGHDEVSDFVAVLFGYALSGERTLEAFYEHLQPCAAAYMALFGRDRLPARSTLSRFLAALTLEPVEALRALFLTAGLSRPLGKEKQTGGLWDRTGTRLAGFRRGWHARGGSPTCFTPDGGPATCPETLAPALRSWLYWAQAWGSRPHAHHCFASPELPVARLVRQPRQRPLPGGTAPCGGGSSQGPRCAPVPAGICPAAAGWAIWHGSGSRRSSWSLLCDGRQRLSAAGSSRGPASSAPARRRIVHSPGK